MTNRLPIYTFLYESHSKTSITKFKTETTDSLKMNNKTDSKNTNRNILNSRKPN